MKHKAMTNRGEARGWTEQPGVKRNQDQERGSSDHATPLLTRLQWLPISTAQPRLLSLASQALQSSRQNPP